MLKELAVPLTLVAILGSLLLPLPPTLLDFLLIGNLLLALMLLVSSLYITDSLKLSSLPTMLLLATLYRLSLNVATTRAILGSGEAGQAVEAFGRVVVGGNLVVGAVVFMVITLIQFIVIAKGSERVAEVAARFTLDALPGKQMSIDADMRAGLIDFETARKRRGEMQTESRFYGALDGAMKFIKGDAIAGLVITLVNIVGGLAAGILLEGLEINRALSKYTLLTVGDGLLSQIPALLNALAAGMVVTRVARGEGETLASELLGQLGQVKRARVIIAVVACLLAFAPGMPTLPFFCLAMILLLGTFVSPKNSSKTENVPEVKFEPKTPAVLQIEISKDVAMKIYARGLLAQRIQVFRQNVYNNHGLILALPEMHLQEDLGNNYRIRMRGVLAAKGVIEVTDPAQICDVLVAALERIVQSRISEFVDDLLTRRTLDQFDREAPELVSAVVPGVVSVTQLSEVLKGLLKEGVPVRNFDLILQAIAEYGSKGSGILTRQLLEDVRIALRRVISNQFANSEGKVPAYMIDAAIEMALAKTEREGGSFDAECIETVVQFLKAEEAQGQSIKERVILVAKAARMLLKECLALHSLNLTVLAHEEVTDDVEIDVCGRIEVQDSALEERLITRLAA